MTKELQVQIDEAIRKSLPGEVGIALGQELSELADFRKTAPGREQERLRHIARINELELKVKDDEILEQKRQELNRREAAIREQEAVMKAREEERAYARNQVFELARIAFDNPKLKFNSSLTIPYSDQGYHDKTHAHIEAGQQTERDRR